jgi:hypothetical protein
MTGGAYAAQTTVASDRSRAEIERTLTRYGASSFAYGWQGQQAMVGFVMHDRHIRFLLPLPDRADRAFTLTPTRRQRTAKQATEAYEQAVRQKWRALALIVKAKLEAVESGIVTFEEEFAMHMLLPDGRTVAEHISPAIETAYATGRVPAMLQIEAAK